MERSRFCSLIRERSWRQKKKDEFMRLGGEVLRFVHPAETDVGCMIKEGIRSAAGKYTALIHGNDWVDTEQFAELIERLQKEEADVVLCRGSYADYEKKSSGRNS